MFLLLITQTMYFKIATGNVTKIKKNLKYFHYGFHPNLLKKKPLEM